MSGNVLSAAARQQCIAVLLAGVKTALEADLPIHTQGACRLGMTPIDAVQLANTLMKVVDDPLEGLSGALLVPDGVELAMRKYAIPGMIYTKSDVEHLFETIDNLRAAVSRGERKLSIASASLGPAIHHAFTANDGGISSAIDILIEEMDEDDWEVAVALVREGAGLPAIEEDDAAEPHASSSFTSGGDDSADDSAVEVKGLHEAFLAENFPRPDDDTFLDDPRKLGEQAGELKPTQAVYQLSDEVREALVRKVAEQAGVDPSQVRLIDIGSSDPEYVQRLLDGGTVLREAPKPDREQHPEGPSDIPPGIRAFRDFLKTLGNRPEKPGYLH